MNTIAEVLFIPGLALVMLVLIVGADFLERYMSGALFSEVVMEEQVFFPSKIIVGRHARSTEMDGLEAYLDVFMGMTEAQKDHYCNAFLRHTIIVPVVN